MPVGSRTQRAEAKYNVTLDFPHLGLHSAASSGNLGLVTFALDHGQPVNSVLDGVLPLHVASSGGNDFIVRLLIERGADVNAPRLPRKYLSDRHRDTSAPIIGSSGSTPLHFAAANGHEKVVLTLLQHGAHPSRPDKHGVTPEMVARQNGWTHCAELLSNWCHEKDRDLRERETLNTPAPEPEATSRLDSSECRPFDKKVKVKRSIDNAINMLRPTLSTPPSSSGQFQPNASYTTSPPPIASSASVDYSPDPYIAEEFPPRRPSLPHIFETVPHGHTHSQSQSSSHQQHSKSTGRPSFSSSRRPRSAGTDAEPSVAASASTSSTPGRIRGKISLLHMFKKSTGDSATSTPGAPPTPESRDSFSGYASSSSAVTSASASPAPDRERDRSRGSSAHSPLRTRASESGLLSSAPGSSYHTALPTVPSSRSRLASESRSNSDTARPPLAVELHHKLSMERLRTRSGSGSSANPAEPPSKAQFPSPQPPPLPQLQGHRSPPVRPGILRSHNRSASSGQSQLPPPMFQQQSEGSASASARSLRFDSISTTAGSSLATKRSGVNLDLMASGSVSSLRGEGQSISGSPRSPFSASSQQRLRDVVADSTDMSSSRRRCRQPTIADDEDEDGYGEVISPRLGLGLALPEGKSSRLGELKKEERERGLGLGLQHRPSFSSQLSRESELSSPLPSPTEADQSQSGFDCPFSINRPPIQPLPPPDASQSQSQARSQALDSDARGNLLGIHGVDNRMRGDSFGSMSTSTDASMPQTPGPDPDQDSGLVPALGLHFRSPDALELELSPELDVNGDVDVDVDGDRRKARGRADSSASRTGEWERERESQRKNERERGQGRARGKVHARSRTMSPSRLRGPALDIDIRAISSHAQAEALVQRAQKSIIDMEDVDIELPGLGLGLFGGSGSGSGSASASAGMGMGAMSGMNGMGGGRTPLSAKLAVYGESLAIERRFKEREREREREGGERSQEGEVGSGGSGETPFGSPTTPSQSQSRGGRRSRDVLRPRRSESGVRKFSLEERERPINGSGSMLVPAPRRTKPKRPHTADGETSDHTDGFSAPGNRQLSPGHHHSLSGSAITGSRLSPSPDANTFLRPPAPARTLPLTTHPSLSNLPPRIVRSRTPDPHYVSIDADVDMPSPVSHTGPAGTFGVPLSRVSTAPPRHASPDIIPQRSINEHERERARANKLMKMGLLVHDSFPRSHSPYGHARNGGGSGGSGFGGGGLGPGGVGKQRFGGFKGFVQTLTGKSS